MNVLAIGAHFDDVELGCGGTLARHVRAGDSVYVYVATRSGYGNPSAEVVRSNDVALAEGRAAMEIIGVKELVCGHFNTFEVEFADPLNVAILRIVEEQKIDRVYTHWIDDVHHDHQAVAKATLHACRHVPNLLMYRSNWYESGASFHANFYVDISDCWDVKEKAISAHASEVNRSDRKWIRYFENEAENAGLRVGVRYAEAFKLVKWLER